MCSWELFGGKLQICDILCSLGSGNDCIALQCIAFLEAIETFKHDATFRILHTIEILRPIQVLNLNTHQTSFLSS